MTGTAGEISGGGKRTVLRDKREQGVYREPRSHKRDPFDFYVEPPWTVDLLLAHWQFDGAIWDPCAGAGTIPRVCRVHGYRAYGSDIVDRGFFALETVGDFLAMPGRPGAIAGAPIGSIVFNPPYRPAEQMIRHALKIAKYEVAALVQAKFLYSQRRHRLFAALPPALVLHLSRRPSMPPGDEFLAGRVEAKGGKTDYSWIVWGRGHADTASLSTVATETRWAMP